MDRCSASQRLLGAFDRPELLHHAIEFLRRREDHVNGASGFPGFDDLERPHRKTVDAGPAERMSP